MVEKKKAVGTQILEEFRENPELNVTTVVEKYNISRAYAFRMKKKAKAEIEEDAFFSDNDKEIPEKFQDILSKKDYWKYEYEDPEEGWSFWKKKGEELQQNRGAAFIFVYYPRSEAEYNEMNLALASKGVPFEHALHDKDYWLHDSPEVVDEETGVLLFEKGERWKRLEPKKLHAHGLMKLDSVTSLASVRALLREVFHGRVANAQICNSVSGYHAYMLHDTEAARREGKFQYCAICPEIRVAENGFTVEYSKEDSKKVLSSIDTYIRHEMFSEFGRYEYCDLCEKFDGQYEVLAVIRGASHHFQHEITSLRKSTNPLSETELDEIPVPMLEKLCIEHQKFIDKATKSLEKRGYNK